MTLLGPSLANLFRKCKKKFTVSTQIRVGIHILYGLKQLHEVGYIHRDIKPANLSIGRKGPESRVIHLLDFGLSREYVKRTGDAPTPGELFSGTLKYCSAQSRSRTEQGRPDDLWSMMYVLAKMRSPLPWNNLYEKKEISVSKEETTDERLFTNLPPKLIEIAKYLWKLTYYSRPDYMLIYRMLMEVMVVNKFKHSDPFDWERAHDSAVLAQKQPNRTLVTKAAKQLKRKFSNIMTISEDTSIAKSDENMQATIGNKTMSESPFHNNDFENNEIGF